MTRDRRLKQRFYFGLWAFSVSEAEKLIAQQPRQPVSIDVASWAKAYGLTHIDDPNITTINLIGPTRESLNRNYATTTDLTKPVILASLETGGEHSPLLIDGVHRLYHAWREGYTRLPAYLLTAQETQQITYERTIGGSTPSNRDNYADPHDPAATDGH